MNVRRLHRWYKWVLALGACGLALCACEQDLRVPYVPPSLVNWPQPYRGVAGLTVHVFNTGFLRVSEALLLQGGSVTRTRDVPVPVFLIEHPTQGLILFNTGLDPRAAEQSGSESWLSQLFRPEVLAVNDLKSQMQAAGFKPQAVRWIILSTMRFDHAGEIEAFPNARVVVAQAERRYARQAPSGYMPSQFDDVASWKLIDFAGTKPLATFAAHVDLFGDGSCLLLDGAGATPGTMALVVRLPRQPLLLADDMAAVEESVRYAAKPVSAYDLSAWWEHIWQLKKLKDLAPELIVVPGHDLQPLRVAHASEVIIHDLGATPRTTPTPDALRRLLPQPM
ncbi:MAG TPA: MBL fold metallo-hydrolase [Candidatus Acidoferrales bacterium]|nr:MBL fold metallo-hydrolase [Candidatus Acidoferrales bacterium]